MDRVKATMRVRRYSPRTEKTYGYWIRFFIHFHGLRHPASMGCSEVRAFLEHLAVERQMNTSLPETLRLSGTLPPGDTDHRSPWHSKSSSGSCYPKDHGRIKVHSAVDQPPIYVCFHWYMMKSLGPSV
nr:site-specific integrase [Halomonas kenyensis]